MSTTSEHLPCVVTATGSQPKFAVIWLHGLGADGHDFEPIVPQLGLQDLAVRFIFPHAPMRPVTINGGMLMRAWYDFTTLTIGAGEVPADIETSVQQVNTLIEAEQAHGISPDRIVLAGFSQGGVIALTAGLRYPLPLAGLVGLSTYLRNDAPLPSVDGARPKVFMGHGLADPLIAVHHGEQTARRLRELGLDITWETYPMAHSVCAQEIADIAAWIRGIFLTVR